MINNLLFILRYFRHAAGSLVILSKNLAQYININRLVLNVLFAQGGSVSYVKDSDGDDVSLDDIKCCFLL
ncbi:hypothetical protein TSUD_08140 [Trifolium subterraneum]|nr:hypothetical protein TSUD_08140 [Trifolium subterraneum]